MIWFHRSEFFEMALSGEWTERKEKKMVLKDCSAEALIVAVNFIYGISVPEDFTQYGDLLHLAELFQMENLKEVVVERLANNLSKGNYLETSKTAELYKATRLIDQCAHFVHEEMSESDEIDWKEMGNLPTVMAAFGRKAMERKSDCAQCALFKPLKKREDFASEDLYGEFVFDSVQGGSIVRLLEDYAEYYVGRWKVGHLGDVVSKCQLEMDGVGVLSVRPLGQQDPVIICAFMVEVPTPQNMV